MAGMISTGVTVVLSQAICEQARLNRDPSFDGRFFFGVSSTGVFCRTICSARAAKEENVSYYPTAGAAKAAGFRPCMRCHPDTAPTTPDEGFALVLPYPSPFDWTIMLDFMTPRLIPGVESVVHQIYRRTFRLGSTSRGWFEVRDNPEQHVLELVVHGSWPKGLNQVQQRVRVMFDLDTELQPIQEHLKQDPLLQPVIERHPALRLPQAWDPFEFAIRAILGQQISIKAATTLAGRLTAAGQLKVESGFPEGLTHYFPSPNELTKIDLSQIGVVTQRQETITTLAHSICDQTLSLNRCPDLDFFVKSMTALRGIGPWTAHYLAMRALAQSDAFPASDLGVLKALAASSGKRPTPKQAEKRAESWRPWRAYATLYLWQISADAAKLETRV